MHKPPSLHDVAAALAPHGTATIHRGVLRLNGAPVAYCQGATIVLDAMDRRGHGWMAAKRTYAAAEHVAADILWRVSECKAVAA